jgi:hypothetical protein
MDAPSAFDPGLAVELERWPLDRLAALTNAYDVAPVQRKQDVLPISLDTECD